MRKFLLALAVTASAASFGATPAQASCFPLVGETGVGLDEEGVHYCEEDMSCEAPSGCGVNETTIGLDGTTVRLEECRNGFCSSSRWGVDGVGIPTVGSNPCAVTLLGCKPGPYVVSGMRVWTGGSAGEPVGCVGFC